VLYNYMIPGGLTSFFLGHLGLGRLLDFLGWCFASTYLLLLYHIYDLLEDFISLFDWNSAVLGHVLICSFVHDRQEAVCNE